MAETGSEPSSRPSRLRQTAATVVTVSFLTAIAAAGPFATAEIRTITLSGGVCCTLAVLTLCLVREAGAMLLGGAVLVFSIAVFLTINALRWSPLDASKQIPSWIQAMQLLSLAVGCHALHRLLRKPSSEASVKYSIRALLLWTVVFSIPLGLYQYLVTHDVGPNMAQSVSVAFAIPVGLVAIWIASRVRAGE